MDLPTAIRNLYSAFSSNRFRPHMVGCPHCVNDEHLALLTSVPMAELTEDLVGHYAFKAMTTWGEPRDYRHFLPRILELSVGPSGWPGLEFESVSHKLAYGGFTTWPGAEQEAVRDFYGALFTRALSSFPSQPPAAVVLSGMGYAGIPVASWLEAWAADDGFEARLQLAQLLCDAGPMLLRKGRLGAVWTGNPAEPRVRAWVGDGARLDRLYEAFMDEQLALLARAVDVWESAFGDGQRDET